MVITEFIWTSCKTNRIANINPFSISGVACGQAIRSYYTGINHLPVSAFIPNAEANVVKRRGVDVMQNLIIGCSFNNHNTSLSLTKNLLSSG